MGSGGWGREGEEEELNEFEVLGFLIERDGAYPMGGTLRHVIGCWLIIKTQEISGFAS